MDLKIFVIGLTIFGLLTTGLWSIAGSVASNAGVTTSEDLTILNQASDIEDKMVDLQENLADPWGGGIGGIIYTTIQAGYSILQSLLSVVDNVKTILFGVNGWIPLPSYIVNGLFTIFMIFFIFSFLSYLRGGKD